MSEGGADVLKGVKVRLKDIKEFFGMSNKDPFKDQELTIAGQIWSGLEGQGKTRITFSTPAGYDRQRANPRDIEVDFSDPEARRIYQDYANRLERASKLNDPTGIEWVMSKLNAAADLKKTNEKL